MHESSDIEPGDKLQLAAPVNWNVAPPHGSNSYDDQTDNPDQRPAMQSNTSVLANVYVYICTTISGWGEVDEGTGLAII